MQLVDSSWRRRELLVWKAAWKFVFSLCIFVLKPGIHVVKLFRMVLFIAIAGWVYRELMLFRHVLSNEQVIHATRLFHEGVEKTLPSDGSRTCWIYSYNNQLGQLENENEFTLKRKTQGKRIFYDIEKAFSSWNVLIFVILLLWHFYFCDNK